MDEKKYMVLSGYDGRVIAKGLTEKQLDSLMAKFVGADCPPPRWKVDHGV